MKTKTVNGYEIMDKATYDRMSKYDDNQFVVCDPGPDNYGDRHDQYDVHGYTIYAHYRAHEFQNEYAVRN